MKKYQTSACDSYSGSTYFTDICGGKSKSFKKTVVFINSSGDTIILLWGIAIHKSVSHDTDISFSSVQRTSILFYI